MYSILPAIVSCLFLFYGLYFVLQKGLTRTSTTFLILCVTTFFWQFTWAVLFQTEEPTTAISLIKLGWLLILFLPTSLYHFVCEITGTRSDLKYVITSYVFSLFLAAMLIVSNFVIDGYYTYFWGYYPKAGLLHPLHIAQTVAVVIRGFIITFQRYLKAKNHEKTKLLSCMTALVVYCIAAVDYLCNYGVEFYPPGVIFIAASLGIIVVAATKFDLMDTARVILASVVHEIRTPLATAKLQTQIIDHCLPLLIDAYKKASARGIIESQIDEETLQALQQSGKDIAREIQNTNQSIDLVLATFSSKGVESDQVSVFSVQQCIKKSLQRYPFNPGETDRVKIITQKDFTLFGSEVHFHFVIHNLLKNALYAIHRKDTGTVTITISHFCVTVEDNGTGIEADTLPHIFDDFYTTKSGLGGTGVGLSFCRRVVTGLGGKIECRSRLHEGTCFTLRFSR